MCCLTQDPSNPYTVAIIDCCTLKITNADGTLIDTFNLLDLDYQIANGILYLKDGVNTRTINVADAPAIFGVADMAAVLAFIDLAVNTCKCDPPVIPVTLDVLNCDGTTTPTTFDSEPAKVEIVQTKPLIICKSSVDFEIGCSSVDGRIVVRTYTQDENGVITSQIFEQDGVTPVADGSILVKCDMDIEDVEFCFQDITDRSIRYRQVLFVNTATNAVVSTIWLDGSGAAIVAPTNIEPCSEVTAVPFQVFCFGTATSNFEVQEIKYSDGSRKFLKVSDNSDVTAAVEAELLLNADALKAGGCDPELDVVVSNWLPLCVDGVQWYQREVGVVDNNLGAITVTTKEYKHGADGAIVTATPVGTVIAEGYCVPCKKEIFATHIKYYYIAGDPIPAGYVAYQPTPTLDVMYPGGNASNVYLHCILPILNGSQTPVTYGGQLNDYFSNPQPGIIFTDVATIQAMTDASAVDMGLQASDFIYAVVNNQPIWYLSPAAIAAIAAPTYLYIVFGQNSLHDQYDEKANVTVLANVIPPSCTPIQQVKEKDSCTGLETYRYIIEDGAGTLVEASTVIVGFDEANVVISCPEPVVEEFDIKEREVCITIDGSAQSYEAIKVYKRSRTSGLATLIHYETKGGDVINGTIAEGRCTCETLWDVPTSASNKVAFGYATLFNGSVVTGDRITGGEELYLDYLEVDGNILVNSPRPLGSTTGGFTATDMGYGIGYNKIVDLLNTVPEFAANGVRFVTAAAPFAPNGTSYDPMMWGVEYDDTKDVRIVLRDKLLISGMSHSYSIRLNPDPAQTYDALINVVTGAANDWDINNVSNYTTPMLLQNITAI